MILGADGSAPEEAVVVVELVVRLVVVTVHNYSDMTSHVVQIFTQFSPH